jgi:NADH:ubiquinone oxidoreductase subunit F (NADH-binding)
VSAVAPLGRHPAAPVGLPRLLAGLGPGRANLASHLDRYGPLPGPVDRRFVDEVEHSGLRGRGGAAFPTAAKMRAVASGRGPRTVVVNAKESEPASSKDELLLTSLPHLVLDGAAVAAEAIDARDVIVAVDRGYAEARAGIDRALEERRAVSDRGPRIRVVDVPSRYIAGEESALVHFLEGGEAKPTLVPPRPFERGVRGRATLVQNVETLAAMALIARFGAAWYREVGPPNEPGSVLLTVGGAVARPSVIEVALDTPVSEVVNAAGGLTTEVSAFLFGGYFGAWLPVATAWTLPVSHDGLACAGVGLGGGVVFAFPSNRCPLVETARVAQWLATESAGQCGPCVHGLAAIADELTLLARSRHRKDSLERLERWAKDVTGRGACRYPDGAARFVTSALDTFRADVHQHWANQPCRAVDDALLPLPDHTAEGWR